MYLIATLFTLFPDFFSLIGNLKHNNLSFTIKGLTAGAKGLWRERLGQLLGGSWLENPSVCARAVWKPSFSWRKIYSPQRPTEEFWLSQVSVGDHSYREPELRLEAKGKHHFRNHQMYCAFDFGKLILKGLSSHHSQPSFILFF